MRLFRYFFSDELPGVILNREVEFSIKLLLGTTPISIVPYRMAPTKLQELKVQKVLFNRVFHHGGANFVCKEKGWHYEIMHRLSIVKSNYIEEQLPFTSDR